MDKGWRLGAFPFAYCKPNVWGAVFGHVLARFCLFFSIVELPKGVVLDDSGAFWEYGENTISKMNAHKCEQSVRPVDDVSGRVIGYKKRINIITDLDSQTLKI